MLIWRGEAALYQFEVIERYHPFLAGKSYGILAKTCDGCIPQELVLIPNISHVILLRQSVGYPGVGLLFAHGITDGGSVTRFRVLRSAVLSAGGDRRR